MFDAILPQLERILYSVPAILGALTVHEFSHAWISSRLGDPLPKAKGRLSLNPLDHIDPIGILMLLIVGFGWAKPVHVDPRYYKNPKWGMALVALAGPVSNLILAFILCFLISLLPLIPLSGTLMEIIWTLLLYGILINLGLALFNMLPLPPLDGSKVLFAFLPSKAYGKMLRLERYGLIILIILLLNIPGRLLSAVGVPDSITMWLNFTTYLAIARDAILDAYMFVLSPLIRLFYP